MNCRNLTIPIALLLACVCVASYPSSNLHAFELPNSLLGNYDNTNKPNTIDAQLFQKTLRSERDFWLNQKKALFLGEGSSEWTGKWADQHISFADILKREYPHLEIWAADLEVPVMQNVDIQTIAIDHRLPFPAVLKDQKFDVVIGMRILCHCKRDNIPSDDMMCGGIHSHEEDHMKQLLIEVIELLDPQNANSFGFLEGEERDRQKNTWMDDIIEAAQLKSKTNWATAIDKANQLTNQFFVSLVPTEADVSLRKAILIRPKI